MRKLTGWSRRLFRFVRSSRAVSALEYAILVGIVAVGIGAALVTFTNQIKTALQNVQKNVAGITAPSTPSTP